MVVSGTSTSVSGTSVDGAGVEAGSGTSTSVSGTSVDGAGGRSGLRLVLELLVDVLFFLFLFLFPQDRIEILADLRLAPPGDLDLRSLDLGRP